jgi:hypothetical protein
VALGHRVGAAPANAGEPAALPSGEGVGNEEGLIGARFVAGDRAGRRLAAARGGGRRYMPLELRLRWRGGAGSASNRHGEVVWGHVKLLGRSVGGGR